MKQANSFFKQIITTVTNKMHNRKSVNYKELPAKVKAFAHLHFADLSIAYVEKNESNYTLTLNDGTELSISKDGIWERIACMHESELISILPPNITSNIKKFFSNAKIVSARKNAKGYIIELSNAVSIKYNYTA